MGAMTAKLLASGDGWRAWDYVCTAGPRDRPFEEQHERISIAVVTGGTFAYRSPLGSALLAPGAILLGNVGQCFECGHEHGAGDRCLAFDFAPHLFDDLAAGIPSVRTARFTAPRLPPMDRLAPLVVATETLRDQGSAASFEELAVRLVGAVMSTLADGEEKPQASNARELRRITETVRWIEAHADEPQPLIDLARKAGMSPYHFLRTFRAVVGVAPHQYVLRTRLHRAALRLRASEEPVSAIAFDAGFGDLSTFNRRFRRVMGMSPSAYRAHR
jgi:AraC family transcriptional regulator